MSQLTKRKPTRRSPPARQDGLTTRRQLLDAAGLVFAGKGYAKATSKEICARANVNAAAVNYHFGGKDGLYAAVLEEAHHRLVSIDAMAEAARSPVDPRVKLQILLGRIVAEVARRDQAAWELRVLSREVLSPSPMMAGLIKRQIAPKAKFARSILGEIMGLPPEHPAVSRSVLNVLGPLVLMLIAPRTLLQKVAPSLDQDVESLTEHLVSYALAGLQATAHKARRRD